MKKSTYAKTALVSLLTLCSFSSFAADFSNENMKEVKKQESTTTSGKIEVMKTSNKKLKEKMDRICNADPKKKAEELKKKEELKLAAERKKEKLVNEKEARVLNDVKSSNLESYRAKKTKTEAEVTKDNVKVINQHIGEKEKVSPVVSISGVDIINTSQGKSGVRITFGGVVDAQGYGKAGPSGEDYRCYNNMVSCYTDPYNQVTGLHPIFGQIENISDYSNDIGMITDAMLHLKAENKNEDLGVLYGADVQLQVPITEGKGASQGINLVRGRSAHLFLNSKYGDLKLGYQFGPEALMRLDATRIATVDGAADSNWFRKVNLEGISKNFPFYVTPRLHTESFSSGSEMFSFYMAGKYHKDIMTTLPFRVAYYSPNYMGAKFGIGYSPRYGSNLFIVENKRHIGPDYEHIVSAGVSYEYDFSKYNMKVKTSVVGEYGLPKQLDEAQLFYNEYIEYDNLVGVNLGVSADYKINEDESVKFAASFAYLGESDQPKNIKKLIDGNYQKIEINGFIGGNREKMEGLGAQFEGDDKSTMYWTAGTSYQYDNLYTSLTYFGSKTGNGNKLYDIALGVQYDLSSTCSKSKFIPYAVLHYFMTDDKGYKEKYTAAPNQGLLFLTGIRFSF
ncbi:WD0745 family porin [Wolbachia endosymbiont of Dirofilaria (Dirofilaria) immitis]|uniref:WD0745 family porin n=1 Tax=Wolbachia endosymbiont of Dirofilaria (Dirofilaria) immitis TaxID=1812115 RepID=UPI00158B83A9|nr:porin [Wolbachia endosymbiont of Dirofilaria (Dirofilaria) immitis]QKX02431.1 porin [Wolbachia endosymbiont of Dirofilaria (Dirofilaria) immitis]